MMETVNFGLLNSTLIKYGANVKTNRFHKNSNLLVYGPVMHDGRSAFLSFAYKTAINCNIPCIPDK